MHCSSSQSKAFAANCTGDFIGVLTYRQEATCSTRDNTEHKEEKGCNLPSRGSYNPDITLQYHRRVDSVKQAENIRTTDPRAITKQMPQILHRTAF
jgi:hypothetical protein